MHDIKHYLHCSCHHVSQGLVPLQVYSHDKDDKIHGRLQGVPRLKHDSCKTI